MEILDIAYKSSQALSRDAVEIHSDVLWSIAMSNLKMSLGLSPIQHYEELASLVNNDRYAVDVSVTDA